MDADRILALCDLLLGAAHADAHFDQREREVVRELLADLHDSDALPPGLEARIDSFDPDGFGVADAAEPFLGDSPEEKRKLLFLVSAVHEADEELDLAEDDYLRQLAAALSLPPDALAGLTIDVEIEELSDAFRAVRKSPPPVPGAAGGSIDVDLDE